MVCVCLLPADAHPQTPDAASDTTVHVKLGGFVDGYYAYDFNRPATLDRAYTTQAARHNEFNINLTFLEATIMAPRLHGRFAAQFGTSVQANYAAEPRLGNLSGADVSRFIQEAYAGYQIAKPLWLDGGVFFSPFGSESWISRDDWTYTRSLIAENSPYYEAGLRLTWAPSATVSTQVHLINGWQNISETNSDKALGLRIDFTPAKNLALAYDAFAGNEMPDSVAARARVWQEVIVQVTPGGKGLQLRGTYDLGLQRRAQNAGNAFWRGWAIIVRQQVVPAIAVAARAEGYSDPEQIIVLTGSTKGLSASGASFNVDITPRTNLLWRSEVRYLHSRHALFPDRSTAGFNTGDAVLVTSIALTL